ncbi:MAG: thiamine pyrophosphate-dependent enzyme, partial [Nocardioidaceae bacterium]
RIPELVARAYDHATAGEPGPVVLSLPEDVLMTMTSAPIASRVCVPAAEPSDDEIGRVVERLTCAARPLVVAGGTGWTGAGVDRLRSFAETNRLPVATTTRNQDLIDNDSPVHVGTLGLRTTDGLPRLAAEADVVLLIGSRPDGLTVGDGDWLAAPQPDQELLHVHPDPDVLNSVYRAEVAVAAGPAAFADALAKYALADAADAGWLARLRRNLERSADAPAAGGDPRAYMSVLNQRLAPDAILTAGAGAYTAWPQRFRRYTHYPSQLASRSGAMGYGLPAAIAAKLAMPEREVVAFSGDGCFGMNGQELSTAVRYGLDLTVVVVNNSTYGTILGHQRREFPGRPSGTALENPDFAALARAHGAYGATATTPEEFAAALDERPSGPSGPSLIEVVFPYP